MPNMGTLMHLLILGVPVELFRIMEALLPW